MKLNFVPNQQQIHRCGFVEMPNYLGDYIKKTKKKDFPRFHLHKLEDGSYDLHLDLRRVHGSFMIWLGKSKKKNVISSSTDKRVLREFSELRLSYLLDKLESISGYFSEIVRIIDKIKKVF